MSGHFILKDKAPVPAGLMEWAEFLQNGDRKVAHTEKGGVCVSTVFIGTSEDELFETMIFGGEHDSFQERCDTWDEAEAEHKKACALAFGVTT